MIKFDKENQIFYLNTKSTTYAFGIFGDAVLLHLYWGKLLHHDLHMDLLTSDFRRRPLTAKDFGVLSSEILPLEFSASGSTDLRIPTFRCVHNDGSSVSEFKYIDHEIVCGKPMLEGLPSTYFETGDKTDTLVVHLFDELKKVHIYLSYSVFEDLDAISRSVKIVNDGDKFDLTNAMSMTLDLYGIPQSDIVHLDGAWARERNVTRRRIVHGNQNIESRCGASSVYHNPFLAVCDKDAGEESGNVYGFSLVYSGNFTAGVEMNAYNTARVYIGINPFDFKYVLETGESFQTPEAVLVYSSNGIGGMSRIFHKLYRTRLCRGKYRDADRFVLINNWEATYFDFDEDKLLSIAEKASEIGIDTMVLDDGWFSNRNSDNAGLGDWYENPQKLPNGLKNLADRINALGMRFGLWFEPEMVNPNSELYRIHPEWVLHTEGRKSHLTRNQLTLDLSRRDVCDYIIETISNVLKKANIEYVKWDMNRYMSDVGSAILPCERQGEVMHRYMLGLYYVLETITSRFPNILFESCASGGGRFDPGMLYYMPQVWTSDDSDAIERLEIQYGTSIVYPYSTMGAHVSACPNHQINRTTPFKMRCDVAMPGQLGFELDLNKCTDEELEQAKTTINEYKRLQRIFHTGDCYRLNSPFEDDLSALEFISEDKNTVICCVYSKNAKPNAVDEFIKLRGMEATDVYLCENTQNLYGADLLMNRGIHFVNDSEHSSQILVFNKQ